MIEVSCADGVRDAFRRGNIALIMSETSGLDRKIRAVIKDHGRLPADIETLPVDADLYEAGMTSHASVNLMLALEERFDIEFPDRLLRRGTFMSIAAIRAGLDEIIGAGA